MFDPENPLSTIPGEPDPEDLDLVEGEDFWEDNEVEGYANGHSPITYTGDA